MGEKSEIVLSKRKKIKIITEVQPLILLDYVTFLGIIRTLQYSGVRSQEPAKNKVESMLADAFDGRSDWQQKMKILKGPLITASITRNADLTQEGV